MPSHNTHRDGNVNPLWTMLLPELRRFAPDEQDQAFRLARETELDLAELMGMAAALVIVTAVTRYTLVDVGPATRLLVTLMNFAVAVPLLVASLGPFHVRRLRRGLRKQLGEREQP